MNFDNLRDYLNKLESNYGIPAYDIRVMKRHEELFRHMAGYSDYKKEAPLTGNELFRLFSATKIVTMTAVMQLIEQGKLHFNDEVRNFLPEFDLMKVTDNFSLDMPFHWPSSAEPYHYAHNTIRIIDLMTMTAGMSYDTDSAEIRAIRQSNPKASTREVMTALAKMPLCWEPGTRYAYSLAHDVLGAVVETISGLKYADYLHKYIFNPLGISDFYFHWDKDESIVNRICAIYCIDQKGNIIPDNDGIMNCFKLTDNYESGGAGLAASVEAYSTFIDALACGGVGYNGNRILSKEYVMKFTVPYTTGIMSNDFALSGKEGYEYGLGVRVLKDQSKSKSPVGEFGWDGAAGAYVLIDPINEISIFYAQHIGNFPTVYSEIHPKIRDMVYEAINN